MASGTKPSLRQRKKDETRDRLIRAGIELFTERGYEATSVDDIAERANYSRATFFRYFATKEEVVFADIARDVTRIREALEVAEPQDMPLQVVRQWITGEMLALSADVSDDASELEAARTALIFQEPALQRRLLELRADTDRAIAAYLADAWGLREPTVECHVVACALTGVSRAVAQSNQWWDRKKMLKALNQGFGVLELGFRWDQPGGEPPWQGNGRVGWLSAKRAQARR